MQQQQILEIGIGFENYVYNLNESFMQKPNYTFGTFRIENLTNPLNHQIPFSESQNKIIKMSSGRNHILLLTVSGKVYGRGWNCYHQLGISMDSENVKRKDYEKLSFIKADLLDGYFVKDIMCGSNFSYFKLNDNLNNNQESTNLYSIGWNYLNCLSQINPSNETSINQLGLVHQKNNTTENIIIPFQFSKNIEFMQGGGSNVVIIVKNNNEQTCFVVGNKNGIGLNENVKYLQKHEQVNDLLKYEKFINLHIETDITIFLTESGNIYLAGRNIFDQTLQLESKFILISNTNDFERKTLKQTFLLDKAILLLTTDNIIYLITYIDTKRVHKLEFNSLIKVVCGRGQFAYVVTNDHKMYLIYSENILFNFDNFFINVDYNKVNEYTYLIGKYELNLSSIISNYEHFINFPTIYNLEMTACCTNCYLLIEKKSNSIFFSNLLKQLTEKEKEERNNFYDVLFN